MIERVHHRSALEQRLDTTPVVALIGARQVGKTTMAQRIGGVRADVHHFDLELPGDLARLAEPELSQQATWTERSVSLGHYRDRDQREVDIVIERGRQVAAVEVKATATPRPRDARHLAFLRDRLDDRFTIGVVLHTGTQRVVLGDRLVAVPVSDLWA
jgi:predicted AAA+ superfamily ATPase